MLPKADATWTLNEAAHLLNRAGFGGNPAEIKAFHAKGREKAVDLLLTAKDEPDAFPLPKWATREQAVADMQARVKQRREIMKSTRGMSPEQADKMRREAFKAIQQAERSPADERVEVDEDVA